MNYSVDLKTLPSLVREFASYKSVVQNASEKTISEYLLDLRTFLRFLQATDMNLDLYEEDLSQIDIRSITIERLALVDTDFLVKFIFYLDNHRDNCGNSKRRKVASLRAFFRYLHTKKHLIPTNPAIDLESPKIRQDLPKYLNLH